MMMGVTDECQDWVNQLDRGGLNHVSSNMYMMMLIMLIAAIELHLQSLQLIKFSAEL